MNAGVKELWLQALRSGEYQKGNGTLRRDNTFCCLGVLCDLYRKETGEGEWKQSSFDTVFKIGSFEKLTVPPPQVFQWAGLNSSNPTLADGTSLAFTNDFRFGLDADFNRIADVIERDL